MTDMSPVRTYLDALAHRVLIYDGAMGTNIQRYNLTPEDFGGKALEGCNDNLVLTRPDVIQAIHESFLAVGCDVVETCTFQSTPRRLAGMGHSATRRASINVAAARLARAAARQVRDAGPAALRRRLDRPDGNAAVEQRPGALARSPSTSCAENFYEQAKYLVEGGVDVLLVETAQDILEVKAALAGLRAAVRRARPPRADPGAGHARHERPHAARHRHRQRDDDARVAAGRRHRPELLDRPRAHARADPLPDRARDACRSR